jgi:D-threo-aldose 1-dehydrogenase
MPRLVSVDAVDEGLTSAESPAERELRVQWILEAASALHPLKAEGQVAGIGACANDWRVLEEMDAVVKLDFVVLSGGLTIMNHPAELVTFIARLTNRGVATINSNVFHDEFLLGGNYFNSRDISRGKDEDRAVLAWRKSFVSLCQGHGIRPAHACVQFGTSVPGIAAVVLETSHAEAVQENIEMLQKKIPRSFWCSMKEEGLVAEEYPHVG